jgi:predicted transcriptional regulator
MIEEITLQKKALAAVTGDWLKEEMRAFNLTAVELSQQTGVALNVISEIRRGKTRFAYTQAIVSIYQFFVIMDLLRQIEMLRED